MTLFLQKVLFGALFVITLYVQMCVTSNNTLVAAHSNSSLTGANVCVTQQTEFKILNVSYVEPVKFKTMVWCLSFPFRCPKWSEKMVEKWRVENITRLVNVARCCKGYEINDNNDGCKPTCSKKCKNGLCVEPETCSCASGFRGDSCEIIGCPSGKWGKQCSTPCPCQQDGQCDPQTGACDCLPGSKGKLCQFKCDKDHFGKNCSGKCNCIRGTQCHHITGECIPCSKGFYGDKCSEICTCFTEGTSLCYHENGNCFCNPNWYGIQCQLYCPFGYIEGVCHNTPTAVGTCSCSSDLYRCDKDFGCVCKDGFDCSGSVMQIINSSLSSTADDDHDASVHRNAVLIAVTLIVITLLVTLAVIIHYKRRLKHLKTTLANRSFYMADSRNNNNCQPMTGGDIRNNGLFISDRHPLEEHPSEPVVISDNSTNRTLRNNASIINNTLINTSTNLNELKEKNVNITSYKLGAAFNFPQSPTHLESSCSEGDLEGASALAISDVNIYSSPTREKDNLKVAQFNRKVAKNVFGDNTMAFDEDESTVPRELAMPMYVELDDEDCTNHSNQQK